MVEESAIIITKTLAALEYDCYTERFFEVV